MIQEIKEYNSDICYEIGKRIKDMRNKRKIKAVELACYLNIGKNQMSRIESGKANSTVPQLYCIAQLLNCSVDFLLFGEEHVNYSPEVVGLINDIFTDVGKLKESIIK